MLQSVNLFYIIFFIGYIDKNDGDARLLHNLLYLS